MISRQQWFSALLLLLGAFFNPTAAHAASLETEQAWFRPGEVWRGQLGSGVGGERSIEIRFNGDASAEIDYPSAPCGGRLEVRTLTAAGGDFRETITRQSDRCPSNSTLTIMPLTKQTLAVVHAGPDGQEVRGRLVLAEGSIAAPAPRITPGTGLAPETTAVLRRVADQVCGLLADSCAEALADILLEGAAITAEVFGSGASAVAVLRMFTSNPGAILPSNERYRVLEAALTDEAFVQAMSDKLQTKQLDRISAGLVFSLAESLVAAAVIEGLATYYDATGQAEAARLVRLVGKPLHDVGAIILAAPTSLAGAGLLASGIWAKNAWTFTMLGLRIVEEEQQGSDTASALQNLVEMNLSITGSLQRGVVWGPAFDQVDPSEPQRLTPRMIERFKEVLNENFRIQAELVEAQVTMSSGLYGRITSSARKLGQLLSPAEAETPASIAGAYRLEGRNPNGSRYTGRVVIEQVGSSDTYRFAWTIGTQRHAGSGTLRDGRIAVDRGSTDPAIYDVQADGTMLGTWAKGVGSESLTPEGGAGLRVTEAALWTDAEVYPSSDDCPSIQAWERCFRSTGAPQAALDFASAMVALGHDPLIVEEFWAFGPVDAIRAHEPWRVNTNQVYFLVNGMEPPLRVEPELAGANVTNFATFFEAHRHLPDGRQRFVFRSLVTDGCRACPIVGDRTTIYDFIDGRLVAIEDKGVAARLAGESGPFLAWPSAAQLAADPGLVQRALLWRGHPSGPVDGATGPETRTAISAFQADYCLPVSGEPDLATLAALASSDGFAPPCEPPAAPEPLFASTGSEMDQSRVAADDPLEALCARFGSSCFDILYDSVSAVLVSLVDEAAGTTQLARAAAYAMKYPAHFLAMDGAADLLLRIADHPQVIHAVDAPLAAMNFADVASEAKRDIVAMLLAGLILELAAGGLEWAGEDELARSIRLWGKPSFHAIWLATHVPATVAGAKVTVALIWARNIAIAVDLSIKLANDHRAGRDIDSTILALQKANASILATLGTGKLTGSLFVAPVPDDTLTDNVRNSLLRMLAENDRILAEAQRVRYSIPGHINAALGRFLAPGDSPVWSGHEHAGSTPSLPPDLAP